jgi:hypothetical protein
MFFNWGADAARENVNRHMRKAERDQLKFIIYSIDMASRQGYDSIKWRHSIYKTNIHKLKELGYRIYYNHYIYEIVW